MFTIKIAAIAVGIENRYPYIHRLCRNYIETEARPAFTVSATAEEICAEQTAGREFVPQDYAESLCLFRKICIELLAYDAFLMHSAAIAVDGEAYAFAAKSGTGKTTHIALWQRELGARAQVVNGDKPIYRFMEGRLYACGTPWQGKEGYGNNCMRPLRAVCFLQRGPVNRICRIGPAEVVGLLFHQLLLPKEEPGLDRLMALLERMLKTVDFYRMECRPDLEAARIAFAAMHGSCEPSFFKAGAADAGEGPQ